MIKLFCIATLALGSAFAADVTIYDNTSVNGTMLKPGAYTVEMQGDKAVFKSGSKTFEVPATMAKSESTFSSTVLVSQHSKLIEIDLGGTQDKIVFSAATASK